MDKNEILKKALISINEYDLCVINNDGIFRPSYDINGNMLKRGEEIYQEYLKLKKNSDME